MADDTHAVANAGLLLPATLAERLGIEQAADQLIDLGERPAATRRSKASRRAGAYPSMVTQAVHARVIAPARPARLARSPRGIATRSDTGPVDARRAPKQPTNPASVGIQAQRALL